MGGQRMARGHMATHMTSKRGARPRFGGLSPILYKVGFFKEFGFFIINYAYY
jgi:hypothetical protein